MGVGARVANCVPVGTPVELRVGVAAGVEVLGAVESEVDEVGGRLLRVGEAAGGVGEDERDAVSPEQPREAGLLEVARVSDLEGVPDGALGLGMGPDAVGRAFAVAAGERGGFGGRMREELEEAGDALLVVVEGLGELPEERPHLPAEPKPARGEEVRERRLDVPLRVAGRALQRVEGAVDLDGVELAAEILQLTPSGQIRRIEAASPGVVAPP